MRVIDAMRWKENIENRKYLYFYIPGVSELFLH